MRSQLGSVSTAHENGSPSTINEPTVLQKRLMELERLLAISQSDVAALKEKRAVDSAALQVANVGVKRDLETASQQLQCAQDTIRAQEALLRQGMCVTILYVCHWKYYHSSFFSRVLFLIALVFFCF